MLKELLSSVQLSLHNTISIYTTSLSHHHLIPVQCFYPKSQLLKNLQLSNFYALITAAVVSIAIARCYNYLFAKYILFVQMLQK